MSVTLRAIGGVERGGKESSLTPAPGLDAEAVSGPDSAVLGAKERSSITCSTSNPGVDVVLGSTFAVLLSR